MKTPLKQRVWHFVRLFRLDIPGFISVMYLLWDVVVLSLIFVSLGCHFGVSFKSAGIMLIISALLLINARRAWRDTRKKREMHHDLPLVISIRLIATVVLSVITGLVLVNAIFTLF